MINKSRLTECILTWWNHLRPSLQVQNSKNPFRSHSTLLEVQHWPTTSWRKRRIKKLLTNLIKVSLPSKKTSIWCPVCSSSSPRSSTQNTPTSEKRIVIVNRVSLQKEPTWTRSPSSNSPPPAPDRHHPTTLPPTPLPTPLTPPHPSGAPLEGESLKNQYSLKRNWNWNRIFLTRSQKWTFTKHAPKS